jgi:amino acid transporter
MNFDTYFLLIGELKQPSRSIPIGSISAILFVFFIYITETFLIASTTDRFVEIVDFFLQNNLFLSDVFFF